MNRRALLKLLSAPLVTGWPARAAGLKPNRIVVAGAGIIGASIAYHLAKRGAEVTIIEKQRPGAGATQNSFAWLNASKQPQPYYELNLLGLLGWRRLCLELGQELKMQWGGSVRWSPPGVAATALNRNLESFRKWGYPMHMADEAEFSHLLPSVTPGPFGAASVSDIEGTVDPMHALDILLKKTQQSGAKLVYPSEITGLPMAGDRVTGVRTSRDSVEADVVVLASGVDTPRLAQMASLDVPLRTSRGLLAHTTPHVKLIERVALAPGSDIKQLPDGRIVTGSDFGATAITEPSRGEGMKLLANAERFLPGLKGAILEYVTLGHRVLPKDGFPIVGFPDRRPNLYIASMHSGMTLCPIIGEIAAMEILDGATVDLLAPFRLSRFS